MNITTIIPVHEYVSGTTDVFLDKALGSVVKQEGITDKVNIIMVYPKSIENDITKQLDNYSDKNLNVQYVLNTGDTGFQNQINLGVEYVETDYFTILEFDDELSLTYYKQAERYTNYYNDIDVFLPMIIETNSEEGIVKFTNETVWSKSFVGENGVLGYLNTKGLNEHTDFKFCGAIFKKSEFESVGKLKSNIVLAFQYEFLLRVLNNGGKVFTIPKFMYKHLITREDSLFDRYEKELSMKARKFWFETAKRECNFPSDREIDTSLIGAE
jgi:hypothetical protein